MTIQEMNGPANLRLVERAWVEALNDKSVEQFLSLHSEGVVLFDPTLAKPLRGHGELRGLIEGLFRMFPDYHVSKVRSFGQDEWVCLEAEETGTMKGPIPGPGGLMVPPTNRSFKIQSSIVCQTTEGKISEVRIYYDALGLMAQLGLKP